MVAQVAADPDFHVVSREVLFEGDFVTNAQHTNYDVHPDGDRFVMVMKEGEQEVVVVLNWVDELERMMERGSGR